MNHSSAVRWFLVPAALLFVAFACGPTVESPGGADGGADSGIADSDSGTSPTSDAGAGGEDAGTDAGTPPTVRDGGALRPPSGAPVITIDPSISHQVMNGWEGVPQIGPNAAPYRDVIVDRLANELGINRVRLEVKSGAHNDVDHYALQKTGAITYQEYRAHRYAPRNTNATYHHTFVKDHLDETVVPLRQKLAERGESLWVNLCFVDFERQAEVGRVSYAIVAGTFSPDEVLDWPTGKGTLIGKLPTATGTLYFRLNSGSLPAVGTTITGATSGATLTTTGGAVNNHYLGEYRARAHPDRVAALFLATFDWMADPAQGNYGFVPDSVELNLEPENGGYSPLQVAQQVYAVGNAFATANRTWPGRAPGWVPEIVTPSTTRAFNAANYFDAVWNHDPAGDSSFPNRQWVKELGYHRYSTVTDTDRNDIRTRGQMHGIRTAMLEWLDARFDTLWDDLKNVNNSSWQQFGFAFPGTNLGSRAVYYVINESGDPSLPSDDPGATVRITNESRQFRQVFLYVRRNAVRKEATSSNATGIDALTWQNANGKWVVVIKANTSGTVWIDGLPPGDYGTTGFANNTEWNKTLPDGTVYVGDALPVDVTGTSTTSGIFTVFQK